MFDNDLADLYEVETKQLNRAVKRNISRFPEIFRFQLTYDESLRFQNGTLNEGRGKHRKYLPYVFTEQGVTMISAVLKSDVAVNVSVRIINAFVQMRRFITQNAILFQRLDLIEQKQLKTDAKVEKVFDLIESKDIKPKQGIFLTDRYLMLIILFLI